MWEIGDRVVVVEAPKKGNRYGLNISASDKGTLIVKRDGRYLIQFDREIGGHDGACEKPLGKDGHCWWMHKEDSYLVSWALELKCKWIPKKRNNNFY
jgi:hypothetical protein